MPSELVPVQALPPWVPDAVRLYLSHTENGLSLRQIARAEGVHASTVLRQVRRFEARRDDPLVDGALNRLRPEGPADIPAAPPGAGRGQAEPKGPRARILANDLTRTETQTMPQSPRSAPDHHEDPRELRLLLQHLSGPGVVLAVAPDMARAVVLRDGPTGSERLMIIDRILAESLALRGWIQCIKAGRVSQYGLASAGRLALRAMPGAEASHAEDARPAHVETPIAILSRRRDRDGRSFLSPEMRRAADQLHHDFTLARMAETVDWRAVVQGRVPARLHNGPAQRVAAALRDLGPGLGDMALRVCCEQEGLEAAERALGWSARSGKIVLRIALEHLARHYAAQGEAMRMIG